MHIVNYFFYLYLLILTLKHHFSKKSVLSKKFAVNVLLIGSQSSVLEIEFFLIIGSVLLNYPSADASNPLRNADVIRCCD